jgi:Domain of unknown function (DUF4159)
MNASLGNLLRVTPSSCPKTVFQASDASSTVSTIEYQVAPDPSTRSNRVTVRTAFEWAIGGRGGMYNQRVAGTVAQWKGIRDDSNRLVVAMTFNSDVGDSWEFADDPRYPDKYSELGIRIGVNYVVYSITH